MISALMLGVDAVAEPIRKSVAGTLYFSSARKVARARVVWLLSSKVRAICFDPLGPLWTTEADAAQAVPLQPQSATRTAPAMMAAKWMNRRLPSDRAPTAALPFIFSS